MNTTTPPKVLSVRISVSDWTNIKGKADQCRLPISTFVRNCVTDRKILAVTDKDTACEVRRLGRMIKHLYPRIASWTPEEKKAYWDAMSELSVLANKIDGRVKEIEAQPASKVGGRHV